MVNGVNKKLNYVEGNSGNFYRLAIGINNQALTQESHCKDYLQDFVYSCLYNPNLEYRIYGFDSNSVTDSDKKIIQNCNRFEIYLIEDSNNVKNKQIDILKLSENILTFFNKFEESHKVSSKIKVEESIFKSKRYNSEERCIIITVDKWYMQKLARLSFLTFFVRQISSLDYVSIFKKSYGFLGKNPTKVLHLLEQFYNGIDLPELKIDTAPEFIHNKTGIYNTLISLTTEYEKINN